MGTRIPAIPATKRLAIMARNRTTPSIGIPNQTRPTIPMITAKTMPLASPTRVSRRIMRHMFFGVRSRVAIARTATVRVCVPALPPIEATIGISIARATTASIVPEKTPMTMDATIDVNRLTASQGKRALVVSQTLSVSSSSPPTPARRLMSSSASSSSASIASSIVITPTKRPSSSTTGAETR